MAEEKLEVRILAEREIETSPALGEKAVTVAVTFIHGDLPPMTVWLPKDQDTPGGRAAAIRARIREAVARPPKVLRV